MATNKSTPPIALWNPIWILIWSFIFSPIFGAVLQKLNWKNIGEFKKADACGNWVTLGIILFFIYLIAEPFLPASAFTDFYFIAFWLAFYFLWAFCQGTHQITFIREHFGNNYHHKLWGKPLMCGAGCMLLWMAISLTYIISLVLLMGDNLPAGLQP